MISPTGETELSKQQTAQIERFLGELPLLSRRRKLKYKYTVSKIVRELPRSLEETTKEDLKAFLEESEDSDLRDSTKRDYRLFSKIFFRWLKGEEFVSFIKVGRAGPSVTADQLLTKDELNLLRNACKELRDRALIETLYETAARPGEFLSLKKSSVLFEDIGATVSLQESKTYVRPVAVLTQARF